MSDFEKLKNYECEGQISLTDLLRAKVVSKEVMNLISWINSQGRAQYAQIGEVIRKTYEQYKESGQLLDRLTNAVSVYVLAQSQGYMEYLRKESEV